jgi:hypothetical protein
MTRDGVARAQNDGLIAPISARRHGFREKRQILNFRRVKAADRFAVRCDVNSLPQTAPRN